MFIQRDHFINLGGILMLCAFSVGCQQLPNHLVHEPVSYSAQYTQTPTPGSRNAVGNIRYRPRSSSLQGVYSYQHQAVNYLEDAEPGRAKVVTNPMGEPRNKLEVPLPSPAPAISPEPETTEPTPATPMPKSPVIPQAPAATPQDSKRSPEETKCETIPYENHTPDQVFQDPSAGCPETASSSQTNGDWTCTPPQQNAGSICLDGSSCGEWLSNVHLGINGSTGNTETFNVLAGYDSTRTEGLGTTVIDIDYFRNTNEGETTRNRLFALGRYEELLAEDSDVFWYGDGWFEYDELRDFQTRIASHLGLGTALCKTEQSKLRGRVGVGTSKAFSGPEKSFLPELNLGVDYNQEVSDTMNLFLISDYYPDFGEWENYRLISQAGIGFLLDEEHDIGLQFRAFHRYSTPSGQSRPYDLDYAITLSKGF